MGKGKVLVMVRMISENRKTPSSPPATKTPRKAAFFFGALKKWLTDDSSLSYTFKMMAIVPPLTPGISMEAPMSIAFSAVIRCFFMVCDSYI